jgi:hypothetical protein
MRLKNRDEKSESKEKGWGVTTTHSTRKVMHTRVKIFAGRNVKLVPDPRYLLKNFTFGVRA